MLAVLLTLAGVLGWVLDSWVLLLVTTALLGLVGFPMWPFYIYRSRAIIAGAGLIVFLWLMWWLVPFRSL